jgi:hypothetical protein
MNSELSYFVGIISDCVALPFFFVVQFYMVARLYIKLVQSEKSSKTSIILQKNEKNR